MEEVLGQRRPSRRRKYKRVSIDSKFDEYYTTRASYSRGLFFLKPRRLLAYSS